MTPEEKSLLERTYKLSEENNTILKGLRRSNRFSLIMRLAYWALILILSFGAYYFIQPYFTTLIGAMGGYPSSAIGVTGNMNQVQDAAKSLQELLK